MSDNLVESDKIGAGNFFWSLPSKAYQNVQFYPIKSKYEANI